jgi:hypothetical protein
MWLFSDESCFIYFIFPWCFLMVEPVTICFLVVVGGQLVILCWRTLREWWQQRQERLARERREALEHKWDRYHSMTIPSDSIYFEPLARKIDARISTPSASGRPEFRQLISYSLPQANGSRVGLRTFGTTETLVLQNMHIQVATRNNRRPDGVMIDETPTSWTIYCLAQHVNDRESFLAFLIAPSSASSSSSSSSAPSTSSYGFFAEKEKEKEKEKEDSGVWTKVESKSHDKPKTATREEKEVPGWPSQYSSSPTQKKRSSSIRRRPPQKAKHQPEEYPLLVLGASSTSAYDETSAPFV